MYDDLIAKARERGVPPWKVIADMAGVPIPGEMLVVDRLNRLERRLDQIERLLRALTQQQLPVSPLPERVDEKERVEESVPDFARENPWLSIIASRG